MLYVRGLDWKLDRVTYSVNTSYGVQGRRALHPLLADALRHPQLAGQPGVHPPGVRDAHRADLHPALPARPQHLPAGALGLQPAGPCRRPWRTRMTIAVIASAVLLALRRIALPEVRIITSAYDYLMLAIAVAPFVTGLIARYAYAHSEPWLIVHVLCGELLLIAIPLTKLSHFVLFFATRAQLGMDYGIKRGGMKSSGINW
ncbi:MAG: hypothetical protein MZV70_19970 [Desulfobacterales bacterium]|nr:hypothetical protein [Desulfobacterales bacterium]